jgi:hypothetical protein
MEIKAILLSKNTRGKDHLGDQIMAGRLTLKLM